MKLRKYFPLQLIVLGILAIMLTPKKVSSCSFQSTNEPNKNIEVKVAVAEAKEADLKSELLFRY